MTIVEHAAEIIVALTGLVTALTVAYRTGHGRGRRRGIAEPCPQCGFAPPGKAK